MIRKLVTVTLLAALLFAPAPAHAEPHPAPHASQTASAPSWSLQHPSQGASSQAAAVDRAAAIPARWQRFAACVLARESGGTLDKPQSGVGALNSGRESAAGRWQFLPSWRTGLPYMIAERLRAFGMSGPDARRVRVHLTRLWNINRYPGVLQDVGFVAVIRAGELGNGKGWRHWNLTGSRCLSYLPARL